MPEPKNRLRFKKISRVSLVDSPDNPLADVLIAKRRDDVSKRIVERDGKYCVVSMDGEKTLGCHDSHADAVAQLKAVEANKDVGKLRGLVQAIGKKLGWKQDEITELMDDVAVDESVEKTEPTGDGTMADATKTEDQKQQAAPAGEAVTKADLEALAKRLDDTEKARTEAEEKVQKQADEIAKMKLDRRNGEFIEKARRDYPSLPIKPETFGPILRKIADGEKLTDEEFKVHEQALAAGNNAFQTAQLFEEIGTGESGEGGAGAVAKVNALVAEIRKIDPKISKEMAEAQVYKENPDLVEAVEAEEYERRVERGVR